MLEIELASAVLHGLVEDEDDDGGDEGRDRSRRDTSMSVLRRSTKPGVGQTLHGVRVPRALRRAWAGVVVSAWLTRRVYRLAKWMCRHWALTAAGVLAFAWVQAAFTWGLAQLAVGTWLAAGVACLAGGMWWERSPASFEARVVVPARSSWRRATVYRREWQPALSLSRLTVTRGGHEALPPLGRVRAGRHFDVIQVKDRDHTADAWSKAAEQLATTFRVEAVRVRRVPNKPGQVELHCRVDDPLRAVVTPAPVPDVVDLARVPVGLREDGRTLTLPANRHLLVAGETGAGKSSALWALTRGVSPAVAAGTLRIIAIDPKGIELAAGGALWYRHCRTGKPAEVVKYLERAVQLMDERKADLGARKMEKFTTKDPAYIILIDEVAALTAWVSDPRLRKRISDALGLLLSQGRALGFWVWMASQLAQKEVLGTMRDLVPARVALRTADAEQADLILGRGSRERGAWTDRIDPRTPGVCFLVEDGVPEPVRGRIAYVSDAEIARVARTVQVSQKPALHVVA